jgi:adenine phosphoribosyltransferase
MRIFMKKDQLQILSEAIRDVPDFPKEGIIFKDITTLLNNKTLFAQSVDFLEDLVQDYSFDSVVGIESRGFIFGSVLAYKLGLNFVPIRKPGKLPAESISEEYDLEYGTDRIEIHADALKPDQKVLLVDDLLATGGTARASCKLIERLDAMVETVLFLVELCFLNGRDLLKEYNVVSLISYA